MGLGPALHPCFPPRSPSHHGISKTKSIVHYWTQKGPLGSSQQHTVGLMSALSLSDCFLVAWGENVGGKVKHVETVSLVIQISMY